MRGEGGAKTIAPVVSTLWGASAPMVPYFPTPLRFVLTGAGEDEEIQRCQKTLDSIISDIRRTNAQRHSQSADSAAATTDTARPHGTPTRTTL